ncbi:chromatin structure-remodeling complex protein BSH isoform X3 [Cryptomeria japonica]|uniref:chromatin structure-remodeling complex protein BSH isoform X3 n=1 Tax=Cryptomeria japonica TaxID=3369 RepID=UPI0025ABC00E|nr:chromatin structure-remodeling complex protein BSH isoform X3 [Cryptomeria japonica]
MKGAGMASKNSTKFRMPTSENLLPIRLDIEIDGHRLKDAFTWNVNDPDSEIAVFARRTVKDLKYPGSFVTPIVQSIQSQLAEFRSFEGQEMNTGEKVLPFKPAIAVAIREQLYEIAIQNVTSGRETRVSKKSRRDRGVDYPSTSKVGGIALDYMKRLGNKISILRRRKEWDFYEPIIDVLSNEEVEALDAREERNARLKRKLDDKDDGYFTRYMRI